MAISLTSRYQRNPTALVTDRNGQQQLAIMHRPPQTQQARVSDMTWTQHQRVDLVAANYYGSETSWWMIAQINPAQLDWTCPAAGTQVMVPRGVA